MSGFCVNQTGWILERMTVDFFQVELEPDWRVAIPLEHTAEVLSLAWSELCPIPGLTPALLGISNQRGRLLWMLDLGLVLNLPGCGGRVGSPEKSTAIVLTQGGLRVAGVVKALKGIVSFDPQEIQPHTHPCLTGQVLQGTTPFPLPILSVERIFQWLQEPTVLTGLV
jgi:twitching motility protein PilI